MAWTAIAACSIVQPLDFVDCICINWRESVLACITRGVSRTIMASCRNTLHMCSDWQYVRVENYIMIDWHRAIGS